MTRPRVAVYWLVCMMCARVADGAACIAWRGGMARCEHCGGNLVREQIGDAPAPLEQFDVEVFQARRGRPRKDRS